MIKTPILTLCERTIHNESIFREKDRRWEFCRSVLSDYFEIPLTATRIQMVGYKRPAKGRVKVEFSCNYQYASLNGEWSRYVLNSSSRRIHRRAKGGLVWYVELYYWED